MNVNSSYSSTALPITTKLTPTSSETQGIPYDKDSLSLILTKNYINLLKPIARQKEIPLREFMLEVLLDKWDQHTLTDASVFVRCLQMIVQLNSDQHACQADFDGFKALSNLCNQRQYLDYKVQDILDASAPSQLTAKLVSCNSTIFPLFEKSLRIISKSYMANFGAKMVHYADTLRQYLSSEKKEVAAEVNHQQTRKMKKIMLPVEPSDVKMAQETKMIDTILHLRVFSKLLEEKTSLFVQELSSLSRQPIHLINDKCFHLAYHIKSMAKSIASLIEKNKTLIKNIDADNEEIIRQKLVSGNHKPYLRPLFDHLTSAIKGTQPNSEASNDAKPDSVAKATGKLMDKVLQQLKPELKEMQKQNLNEKDLEILFEIFASEGEKIMPKPQDKHKRKTKYEPDFSQLYYVEKRKKFEDILAMVEPLESTFHPCLQALTAYIKHHAEHGTYTKDEINLEALWLELIPPTVQRECRKAAVDEITITSSDSEDSEEVDAIESIAQNRDEIELPFLSQTHKERKYLQGLFVNHPYTHLLYEKDPQLSKDFVRDNLHHLRQLFLGYDLLQNALHDPSTLAAIIPGLILDMGAISEHAVAIHYWKKFESLPETHSLTDSLSSTQIWKELNSSDKAKLVQFNKGTVWARYPHTSALNYETRPMPEALALIMKTQSNTLSATERVQIFNQIRTLMIHCLSLQETLLGSKRKVDWKGLFSRKDSEIPTPTSAQPNPTQHPALDGLIANISSLGSSLQIKEAMSHLNRFKASLQLADHCKNQYQGVVYRNLLSVSIALEQLLQKACLDEGHDLLLTHHLGDFIKLLSPEKISQSNLLELSVGRGLYYPGCYQDNGMVKTLLTLEKRAEQYRDVEEQFEMPGDKHKELFAASVKSLEAKSILGLQDCLTCLKQGVVA